LKNENNDLAPHWGVVGLMLATLLVYVGICHWYGHGLSQPLPENSRVLARTIFYAAAIVIFPFTNLLRHIQLRLNQTMPGNKSAKSRYLLTVIVSMVLVESVGLFGFVMYMLGDDYNTLYIFTGLSVLGMYLYRPKVDEYENIVEALSGRTE
jgi:hypothetical protein